MSDTAYFEQAEQNIEILISEGKFKEAYEKCKRHLLQFPDENIFQKLKEKIEEKVQEKNEKVIDEKINEVKSLWKENNYVGILNKLKPLLKIDPENSRLRKLISKAQEEYKVKVEKLQKEFGKTQVEKLSKLLEEDGKLLLEELFLLEKNNPGNRQILRLTSDFRNKLIRKKIKEKSDLIRSEKYDDIENFISQLRKIDKKNSQIEKLEKSVKLQKHDTQLDEKSEYLYKSHTHLDTLMRLKKFDKAIIVANEILEVDENNEKILKTLKKAENLYFKSTKKTSIESIGKSLQNLSKEYKKDKTQFVKI